MVAFFVYQHQKVNNSWGDAMREELFFFENL